MSERSLLPRVTRFAPKTVRAELVEAHETHALRQAQGEREGGATHVRSALGSRVAEMAAIFMIGDGLLGLVQTRRHVALWKENALGSEKLVAPFVDRPGRRRLYALVQIGAGLALAARQRRE